MADKGFDIQDLLAPLGVKLNIPLFCHLTANFLAKMLCVQRKLRSCEYMWREPSGESKNSVSCNPQFVPPCGTPSMKSYMFVPCCVILVLLLFVKYVQSQDFPLDVPTTLIINRVDYVIYIYICTYVCIFEVCVW